MSAKTTTVRPTSRSERRRNSPVSSSPSDKKVSELPAAMALMPLTMREPARTQPTIEAKSWTSSRSRASRGKRPSRMTKKKSPSIGRWSLARVRTNRRAGLGVVLRAARSSAASRASSMRKRLGVRRRAQMNAADASRMGTKAAVVRHGDTTLALPLRSVSSQELPTCR